MEKNVNAGFSILENTSNNIHNDHDISNLQFKENYSILSNERVI